MKTLIGCSIAVAIMLGSHQGARPTENPIPPAKEVNVCALQTDPAAYDRNTIQVGGIVAHGFEQFVLSDPECGGRSTIWLEYGGERNSDTVYCCGTTAGAPRGGTLIVEGMPLPLIKDALFRRFDARIGAANASTFRATLVGRFFAGAKQQSSGGEFWGGYGHLGCCSLLVIQRILAVDTREGERPPDVGAGRQAA